MKYAVIALAIAAFAGSASAADKVTSASAVMAGNQLVLYSLFGTKYDKAHAVVVEIGEPAAG